MLLFHGLAGGGAFADWGVVGAPGWFGNSGELGIQLTIFVPLSCAFVYSLWSNWGRFFKFLFLMMPISAVGSIIASSSRGAVLGLIALGVWLIKSSKYFVRSILVLSLICSLLYVLTPPEFKERFLSSGSDKTSTHRLDRWVAGFDLMLKRPLLGVGHKNWTSYYERHYSDGANQSLMIHNIFMESGTEHGFLGLLTLLSILFMMFRLNLKTREFALAHAMLFEYRLTYGMSMAIVGMAVSSCFVTVLYYPYVWIHAAFIVALYNSTCNRPPVEENRILEK